MPDAPDRTEGDGPYDRLIIRGGTMIDGTGSPALGPVDIVIEQNRIALIQNVGYPGVPINEDRRPEADDQTQVIDAKGMYILPGFFDMHAHTGGTSQGTTPEYVYKLWLAHGITSIREPGHLTDSTGHSAMPNEAAKTVLRHQANISVHRFWLRCPITHPNA